MLTQSHSGTQTTFVRNNKHMSELDLGGWGVMRCRAGTMFSEVLDPIVVLRVIRALALSIFKYHISAASLVDWRQLL